MREGVGDPVKARSSYAYEKDHPAIAADRARILEESPEMAAHVERNNRLSKLYAGRASTSSGPMPRKVKEAKR